MPDSHPFVYHAPTPDQTQRIQLVREALRTSHEILLSAVPAGRERSLAITKLEECSMWANKAIVFGADGVELVIWRDLQDVRQYTSRDDYERAKAQGLVREVPPH